MTARRGPPARGEREPQNRSFQAPERLTHGALLPQVRVRAVALSTERQRFLLPGLRLLLQLNPRDAAHRQLLEGLHEQPGALGECADARALQLLSRLAAPLRPQFTLFLGIVIPAVFVVIFGLVGCYLRNKRANQQAAATQMVFSPGLAPQQGGVTIVASPLYGGATAYGAAPPFAPQYGGPQYAVAPAGTPYAGAPGAPQQWGAPQPQPWEGAQPSYGGAPQPYGGAPPSFGGAQPGPPAWTPPQ